MSNYVKEPLNYTGGKHKLLPQILPLFPKEINTFVDLFCGGGNVTVNAEAKRIIGNDSESHVIRIYQYLKTHTIDEIISQIEEIIKDYSLSLENAEGFNKLRSDYNNPQYNKYDVNIMLYVLICFSFNHQFRFNSKGEFNMPFGKDRSRWNDTMKKNLINFQKNNNR